MLDKLTYLLSEVKPRRRSLKTGIKENKRQRDPIAQLYGTNGTYVQEKKKKKKKITHQKQITTRERIRLAKLIPRLAVDSKLGVDIILQQSPMER